MTLTGEDIGLLATIVGVPWSVLSLYLRAMRKEATERSAAIERRVETLEQEFREATERFANKRDWLREAVSTREKVDAVGRQIADLGARFDANYGIAASINTLAEALKERK